MSASKSPGFAATIPLLTLAAVLFGAAGGGAQSISFRDYAVLTNSQPATSACCPEVSIAENGQTVMMTGNVWILELRL